MSAPVSTSAPAVPTMPGVRPRLLLLDGHSLAYRAFFALPVENFSTTTGQPTNAVYGFTAMLINVLRDEAPTHVAVTFDVSKSTFRTETYADYKAGRAETPTDFKGQVSLVREVLDALRVPIVCAEGFEADDVIATLASAAPASAGARPRLLLLDGHSLAYRAFFALPVENFSTTTGQPTNAVYGFTSMLINILRDEQPTHLAVAFDVGRKTFRSEIFAEYKANRAESPTDFRGQVSLVQEVLGALRVPVITAEGYEADDVIATLTVQAVEQGMDVLIATGDRDALQLVNEHVTVLYPRKGVSDMTRFTPEAVEEKYGLTPTQYPDFAALRGDPSDNLPSIPSVGEKTAAKWVR